MSRCGVGNEGERLQQQAGRRPLSAELAPWQSWIARSRPAGRGGAGRGGAV